MGSYYYLMSSFPSLDLKTAPTVSLRDFIQAVTAQLSEKEASALLEILSDEPGCVKGAAADYLRWDKAVRNALVKLRAGGESAADCREGESIPSAAATAAALMKIDSPLKAEQFFLISMRRHCMRCSFELPNETPGFESIRVNGIMRNFTKQ